VTKHSLRPFFAALLLVTGFHLQAQHAAKFPARVITAVSVTGLTRTRSYVAEYSLQKFIGQDGMGIDFNDVYAAIAGTGILEPLSIGVRETPDRNGMVLTVNVREKWAFFPIPVFFADSNGTLGGGGALMDANAFGLNDKFIAAGTYSNSGWFASLIYQNTPERKHFPGWNIMGIYGRQIQRDTDQYKTNLRKYKQDIIIGSLGIQYPVTDLFTVSTSLSFSRRTVRESEDSLLPPEKGILAGEINPALELSSSHWDGYLLSQRRAKLDYTFMPVLNAAPLHTLSLRGNYEISVIPGFKAGLRGGIYYRPDAPPLLESSASSAGFNILPSTFSARHYAGAALGFEKYLYKFSQGIMAFLISYQAVYSYGPILEHEFDHGVTGALNFYLSRIAIPAMGIGVSYNVAAKEFTVSFNMGTSF
jgi:outer membrane protein assembly factor BamA